MGGGKADDGGGGVSSIAFSMMHRGRFDGVSITHTSHFLNSCVPSAKCQVPNAIMGHGG